MPLGMVVRSRFRPHCVRWGPSSLPAKRGHSPPQFSAHICCDQTAGWIKMPLGTDVGLGPGHIVLDGDPAPPTTGTASPCLSAHVYCGQMAGRIRIPLGTEVGLGPRNIVIWGPSLPPTERGTASPYLSAHVCCDQTVAHLSNC